MGYSARQRISVGPSYIYPSRWTKRFITALFAGSIKEGRVDLQFQDEIVEVGSGRYVATIAPPSFLRLVRMLIRPDYRVPSFYTKGYWCCESGKLYEFL